MRADEMIEAKFDTGQVTLNKLSLGVGYVWQAAGTALDLSRQIPENEEKVVLSELGLKPGQLFGSIRVAISGRMATPPLFAMMEVLGRRRTMRRIEEAIARLAG